MGLLENSGVLDVGYKVYFDNYYTSMNFMHELISRYTFACGTVCTNRKGLPVAVTKSKLKRGQSVFRHMSEILCMKHHEREVCLLSTIHDAKEVLVKNRLGNHVLKPERIVDYNRHMSGCDLADQLMTSYSFLRCNLKWWRKLFFHLLLLLLNNAYILNKKFGNVSLNHEQYLEYIAKHLINSAMGTATKLPKQFKVSGQKVDAEKRLSERLFPSHIQEQPMSKQLSLCGYVLLAISAKQSANRLLAELKTLNASLLLTVAQIVMFHCVWNHAFVFSTPKRIMKNIS